MIGHHAIVYKTNTVRGLVLDLLTVDLELRELYFDKMGIDDVRAVVTQVYQSPVDAKAQCVVVRAQFITLEAQNALLKILEEPPKTARFIFILPIDFYILPTLQSRFGSIEKKIAIDGSEAEFELFKKMAIAERLQKIDFALKSKDGDWQRFIKQGLIIYLQKIHAVEKVGQLEFVARWLLTRGASNKMLLEQLALLL